MRPQGQAEEQRVGGAPILFVFSQPWPWPEARKEAPEDRALEREPRAKSFKQLLKKETTVLINPPN